MHDPRNEARRHLWQAIRVGAEALTWIAFGLAVWLCLGLLALE